MVRHIKLGRHLYRQSKPPGLWQPAIHHRLHLSLENCAFRHKINQEPGHMDRALDYPNLHRKGKKARVVTATRSSHPTRALPGCRGPTSGAYEVLIECIGCTNDARMKYDRSPMDEALLRSPTAPKQPKAACPLRFAPRVLTRKNTEYVRERRLN